MHGSLRGSSIIKVGARSCLHLVSRNVQNRKQTHVGLNKGVFSIRKLLISYRQCTSSKCNISSLKRCILCGINQFRKFQYVSIPNVISNYLYQDIDVLMLKSDSLNHLVRKIKYVPLGRQKNIINVILDFSIKLSMKICKQWQLWNIENERLTIQLTVRNQMLMYPI